MHATPPIHYIIIIKHSAISEEQPIGLHDGMFSPTVEVSRITLYFVVFFFFLCVCVCVCVCVCARTTQLVDVDRSSIIWAQ